MNNQNWNYKMLGIVGYIAFIALAILGCYQLGQILGSF